ncbi:MAG TPA: hypothetical protein VHO70_06175 [Chitinispirillaceae bacterium]|nr:hypothetical protein [Chitinispirillaceae bacterium]
MTARNSVYSSVVVLVLSLFTICTLPMDPAKNPKNAKIEKENVRQLPSAVPMGSVFKCTLVVALPELVDSFTISKSTGTVSTVIASGDSLSDTICFTLELLQPDDYLISIILYKAAYLDTLEKKISVFSTIPLSSISTSSLTMHIGENVTIPFTLKDPDSNLMRYTINRNDLLTDTFDVKVADRAGLSGVIVPDSGVKLKRLNSYVVEAIDVDSQYSKAALCTLMVIDSVYPKITPVTILTDSKLTVLSLPCTLCVVITDDWCIDSVKVSGAHANLPEKDSIRIVKTFLDTGLTSDSIEVWDRGGNRSVLRYKLEYHGVVQYPPTLKPIVVTPIFERETFDTLNLDSYVEITDASANYSKDSLVWTITVETPDSIITHVFDPVTRMLYVNVPDVEIGFDRYIALNIKVTDPKGLSDILYRVSFWVLEKNDAPVLNIKNQTKFFGAAFDTLVLDKIGSDSDPSDRITWKIEAGKYFKPDSIYTLLSRNVTLKAANSIIKPIRIFTGKVAIIPDTTRFKTASIPSTTLEITDSLKFTASDGELSTSKYVKFTWNRLLIKDF